MRNTLFASLALAAFTQGVQANDGDFDTSYGLFNSGKNVFSLDLGGTNRDTLSDMLVAPDGSAYLVGTVDMGGGLTRVGVVHVDAHGGLDQAFGNGQGYHLLGPINVPFIAQRAAFDAQGNVLIAAVAVTTDNAFALVGIMPDGHAMSFNNAAYISTDFDLGGTNDDRTNAVLVLPNGDYILAGSAATLTGRELALARFNPDGTPDPIFGGGQVVHYALPNVNSMEISALAYHDGKLLVAGSSKSSPGAASDMFITRVAAITGARDSAFGANGVCAITFPQGVGANDNAGINSLVVQADGNIYAAGYAQIDVDRYKGAMVKLAEGCVADSSFGTLGRTYLASGYSLSFNKLAIQGDGKVVAVGTRKANANSDTRIDVARFNADGTLDTAFGTAGESIIGFGLAGGNDTGVAAAVDGRRIYAAGHSFASASNSDFVIAGLRNDLIFAWNFED